MNRAAFESRQNLSVCRRPRERGGYTLVEVLIASVLIAVLMGAGWNLMSLYGAFMTAGRSDVAERQLARSLFQLIEQDARLVNVPTSRSRDATFPRTVPELPEIQTLTSVLEGVNTPGDTEGTSEVFAVDATIEFAGASDWFRITYLAESEGEPIVASKEQGRDSLRLSEDDTGDQPGGEARSVLYFFNEPEALTPTDQTLPFGLHRVEASAFDAQSARQQSRDADPREREDGPAGFDISPPSVLGPARQGLETVQQVPDAEDGLRRGLRSGGSMDRLTYDQLFQPTDSLTRALDDVVVSRFEPTHDHAPEVVRAQFEYYDGERWGDRWSTRRRRSLPTMIRITLWVVSAEELETIQSVLSEQALQGEEPDSLPGIRPRRYQRTLTLSPIALPEDSLDVSGDDSFGGFE